MELTRAPFKRARHVGVDNRDPCLKGGRIGHFALDGQRERYGVGLRALQTRGVLKITAITGQCGGDNLLLAHELVHAHTQALSIAGGFCASLLWVMAVCVLAMRRGNRGRRSRAGGWLLVLFSLTFFAPVVIWMVGQIDLSRFDIETERNRFNLTIQAFFLILSGLITLRLARSEQERREANERALNGWLFAMMVRGLISMRRLRRQA